MRDRDSKREIQRHVDIRTTTYYSESEQISSADEGHTFVIMPANHCGLICWHDFTSSSSSHFTPHTTYLTRLTLHYTPHTSHLTLHTSCLTHYDCSQPGRHFSQAVRESSQSGRDLSQPGRESCLPERNSSQHGRVCS